MAWSLTKEEQASVRKAFLEIDQDKSGTISLLDLKKVLTERFDVEDEMIIPIFDALDTSQTEEIHYTEFLAAMVSTKIEMHDDMLSDAFKRFDIQNTGYIDAANLKRILGETFDGATVQQLLEDSQLIDEDGRVSYGDFVMHLK